MSDSYELSDSTRTKILDAILFGNDYCKSFSYLVDQNILERKNLKKALNTLVTNHYIRKNGDIYCLQEDTVLQDAEIRTHDGINKSLKSAKYPLTTRELSQNLDIDYKTVSRLCHRFENKGYLVRGEPSEKRMFFAPITGEIIHRGNYKRITNAYKELHGIISDHNLGDPRLKTSLQKFFGTILSQSGNAEYRDSIHSFQVDLLKTVSTAKEKNDIHQLLGVRPFTQKVITWKSAF